MLSGVLGHVFLDLCRVSDSEVAAVVVEHSVVIRDSCFDDLQPMCTWRAVRRLLRICNAYDGVVGTWVLIPCIAGTTFRRIDEKLGAETGDFVMSYKSAVAAVGMSRRAVGSGDLMVLCSACMYAFSSVLQEKLLKQGCTVKEALGNLGVFGTLISVLQAWSLGWTRFVEVTWTSPMTLSVFGFLMCFFGMYELVNLFFSEADAANLSLPNSDIPSRENSGTDVERLMDKFNLDLPLVARLGGLSDHRSHKGKERFLCTTITYAVIQMVERIAEKSDKAKIITDGARTGCIYMKGIADFKESGPETVIFTSGDFGADFTQNSLPATSRLDLLHLPITNGELYNGDATSMCSGSVRVATQCVGGSC